MSRVLLILIAALSIGAKGCGIDTGDLVLSDFVRTYDLTVKNAGSVPVRATVVFKDVGRAMVIDPGGSETMTSFSGGKYLVTARSASDSVLSLIPKRDEINNKLRDPNLDERGWHALVAELHRLNEEINDPTNHEGVGSCTGGLKVNADGKGGSAVVSLVYLDTFHRWAPVCP